MASPQYGVQMVAKYQCQCGYKWKSKNSSGGEKFCKMCYKGVMPYKFRPAKPDEMKSVKKTHAPRRLFGEFFCSDCEKKWFSGNAWEGKRQQCSECLNWHLPVTLRPLRRPRYDERNHKPHPEGLCEKCKELGYSCRIYRPGPNEDEEEDDDAVSVISYYSETADSSAAPSVADENDLDDGELTPTPSDSEEAEQLLDQLENMKISK